MHYTIDRLISDVDDIQRYYSAAVQRWKTIVGSASFSDTQNLARSLRSEQMWFEQNCGGRSLGQEIMVIVGIAQFYRISDGFDVRLPSAMRVYEAIQMSYCSLEVKHQAKRVAQVYGLLGD